MNTRVCGFLTSTIIAIIVAFLCLFAGCRSRSASFSAEVTTAGSPLRGKLFLSTKHIRIDWGPFADVFDLKQRKGWHILGDSKTYWELGSDDLSTYAPEMTGGSLCPHAQVPTRCKLLGTEVVEGRRAKKWDVYNPDGFRVSLWTDEELGIVLRMRVGDTTTYRLNGLHQDSVSDSMFQLPDGFRKVEPEYSW